MLIPRVESFYITFCWLKLSYDFPGKWESSVNGNSVILVATGAVPSITESNKICLLSKICISSEFRVHLFIFLLFSKIQNWLTLRGVGELNVPKIQKVANTARSRILRWLTLRGVLLSHILSWRRPLLVLKENSKFKTKYMQLFHQIHFLLIF